MIPLSSRIEAVTVYNRGARVTRVADLPGATTGSIVVTGLPLALDDGSVRARVEPKNGGRVPIASDVRIALDVPEEDPTLRPAEDQSLEAARLEEARLGALLSQIEHELHRLENLVVAPRPQSEEGKPPPESPTGARLKLLEFRDQQASKLFEELHDARDRLRKAQRLRSQLEDRDRRATTARQARESELRKSAVIAIDAPAEEAADGRLVIEYMVPGARWAPAYVAHVSRKSDDARLALRAMVAQRTGEDWSGVELTLSTADAHGWSDLPELASVRIGRKQPRPAKLGWRPPPTGAEALFADYDAAFPARAERKPRPKTAPMFPQDHRRDDVTTPSAAMPAMDEDSSVMEVAKKANLVSRSGPPMPPPRAMPAPAGAPPAPGAMPAPQAARSRARTAVGGYGGGGMDDLEEMAGGLAPESVTSSYAMQTLSMDEPAEPEPAGLTASEDMLAYGKLRMPPPQSRSRGRLVVAERRELYLALLEHKHIEVSFDVVSVVNSATLTAEAVAHKRAPAGCTPAWSGSYDYAYRSETSVDIPSDGDYHSIPLTSRPSSCEMRYVVVPRESTDVFRFAQLRNSLSAPLLVGPCDVYIDDQFLLTTDLRFTAPDAEVRLGLGVEQAIKVSRNTKFDEDTAGLLGGSRELTHAIHIEARNLMNQAIDLEVRERVPTVREGEEEIKVEVSGVNPPWKPFDPFPDEPGDSALRGGYAWRAKITAGEISKFDVGYEIKISSKHELVGGNRREG